MNKTAALFISVILLTQIASYSLNEIQPQIDREESFQEDSTWDVSGRNNSSGGGSGNNSGPMELIQAWPGSSNYTTNDIVNISWDAEDLVTSITYNATVDIFGHNATSNTNSVIWNDFTVFTATSNASSGDWNLPSATLPTGCYFVSVGLYDNSDGMHLANDGFNLDIGMDCSNSGGNGTGNNSGPMEWVQTADWGSTIYTTNNLPDISWTAGDLVANITYNVTLEIFAHDMATNTDYVIYDDFTVFTATSNFNAGLWNVPNGTLPAGCYYVSIALFDDSDGMYFDNDGYELSVETDCSGGSGNNTGNASGASVNAWPTDGTGWDIISDYEMTSTSADITIYLSNLSNESQYSLEYEITNEAGSIVDWYSWNWTAGINDIEIYERAVGHLGQGCYDFEVWLTDYSFSSSEVGYLEYENWPFTIDMTFADCNNNTGGNGTGNNTGNTTDDCGTLENLTEVMVWTDQTMYDEGDTVEATFVTNCTVLNQTYNLGYEVIGATSGAGFTGNVWNWTAYYTSDIHTDNWSGLNAGNYVVQVSLMDASYNTIVSGTYSFSVNALSTAWDNETARFIYIKPLAQNADEHTPFNLTFPAPPMAGGSPYASNMICSKAAGHSADVWETYVPMPFNNITSWKVENTYGLVMGMFVMYDAQWNGINTMQNPTVIFEQNMSFSGHAPSELVDQAYFDCPMVTVSSSLSPVTTTTGSVLSYVAGLSVNNSGDWTGDLNWEVATVTNGSSTALTDIGGHLLVEASGALLDHNFNTTGITVADEICLNWELIDESGVELASGSECIDFSAIGEGSEEDCEAWEYWNPELVDPTLPGNGCPHFTDGNDPALDNEDDAEDIVDDNSGALPAVGVFGTLVASVFAVFIIAIRRDEE